MSKFTLRTPESMARDLEELAQEENVSKHQFVLLAVAEKIERLKCRKDMDAMEERRKRAHLDAALEAMAQVPDGEVQEGDEIVEREPTMADVIAGPVVSIEELESGAERGAE